jgi:hypothetical protein
MARNIGFLKLEFGLSAMSKDDLAGSLAYNSLKVKIFRVINRLLVTSFMIVLMPPFFVGLNLEQCFKGTKEC